MGTDFVLAAQDAKRRFAPHVGWGPLVPYSPETMPLYGDQFWNFDAAHGFVSGQGNTATTLSAQASAGATTLALTNAALCEPQIGTPLLVIAGASTTPPVDGSAASYPYTYAIVTATATRSTNNVTTVPPLPATFASGSVVVPLWTNDAHLTTWGFIIFCQWLAQLTRRKTVTGLNLFASPHTSVRGTVNTVANVPTNFYPLDAGSSSFASFSNGTYATASAAPNARQGTSGFFSATAASQGVATNSDIHVRPGDIIVAQAMLETNAGAPVFRVVDKDVKATILAGPQVIGSNALGGFSRMQQYTLKFAVPAGVKNIELQWLSAANGDHLWFDDVRVFRAQHGSYLDLPAVPDPGLGTIVVQGDSWGLAQNAGGYISAALAAAFGRTVNVIVQATTGRTHAAMLTAFDTEVLTYRPRALIDITGYQNDITQRTQQQTLDDTDAYIEKCRKYGIALISAGIGPTQSVLSTAVAWNDLIRARFDRVDA